MTDDMMNLRSFVEKSADADLLRDMIGFAAEKLGPHEARSFRHSLHQLQRQLPVPSSRVFRRLLGLAKLLVPAKELADMDSSSAGNLRDNRMRLKAGRDKPPLSSCDQRRRR
ncbi:hypothetical protein LJR098_002008 [Rhizobium sp. LjRoot98]|uniref:hypothetical protein n=1 Tax=unclassified Rhizobium TaxID=2613769 RepID=UPI000713EBE1|nr:hypothetical protein [Rhizobium sp. Root1204]KQV37750.1 hypothetical protein ASC96_26115 [Rhizobium sp. Root1204]